MRLAARISGRRFHDGEGDPVIGSPNTMPARSARLEESQDRVCEYGQWGTRTQ